MADARGRKHRPLPAIGRMLRQLVPLGGEALEQLRAEWRGHALTLVGIVWGAASVIPFVDVRASGEQLPAGI